MSAVNTFKLLENNKTLAEISLQILDIKSIIWVDSLKKEQKQDGGWTKTAFYGEKLKLIVESIGIEDGVELEIEMKAKKDDGTLVELKDDDDLPIKISAKTMSNKTTFDSFYVDPKWFDKDSVLTFLFDLTVKADQTSLGIDLPTESEYQLKPKGFGKPDLFKISKDKTYLLVKNSDGTKTGHTSGVRLDIEKYQEWFEDESEELDFANRKQVNSYFKSVYLTYVFGWSIRGEFGTAANRKKIIAAFDKAGKKYSIPPSVLYTFACGEGMLAICSRGASTNLDAKIDSFQGFGLDFFEKQVVNMRTKGYLDATYNSAGTAVDGSSVTYPSPFNGEYAIIRYSDGSTRKRSESADNGKTVSVYPVYFKNMESGIEGACAVYANAFDYATKSAKSTGVGWGDLTLNQQVFFAYLKIQKTSEQGNAEVNLYRKKTDANFLDANYTKTNNDYGGIPNKSYHRWVAWRYIRLGKHFSE